MLRLAVTAARWCRHDRVGPGHVLFGLTQTNGGATDILQGFGLDASSIRKELELDGIPTSTLAGFSPDWCPMSRLLSASLHELRDLNEDELAELSTQWPKAQRQAVQISSDGKALLRMAQTEASNLGHKYVGTEHLLLGMLWGSDAVAGRALAQTNLDLATVRTRVRALTVPENGWDQRKK